MQTGGVISEFAIVLPCMLC